jgi:hypothetical protein
MSALSDPTECIVLSVTLERVTSARWSNQSVLIAHVENIFEISCQSLQTEHIDKIAIAKFMTKIKCYVQSTHHFRLLLSGAHLEQNISVYALQALEEGFDAYLLCDLIAARERLPVAGYPERPAAKLDHVQLSRLWS